MVERPAAHAPPRPRLGLRGRRRDEAERRSIRAVRPRPDRIERLPEQYFTTLLARVTQSRPGRTLIDLGRGNPDVPPPPHVDRGARRVGARADRRRPRLPALRGPARAAGGDRAPLRGRLRRRARPGARGRVPAGDEDGAHRARALLAQDGERILLPDPGYPDYNSAVALAGAERVALPLDDDGPPRLGTRRRGSGSPRSTSTTPSNPAAVAAPTASSRRRSRSRTRRARPSCTTSRTATSSSTAAAPRSFLAEPGAREVGVELFSLSKSYGMAGWRLGFVVGNAEIVDAADVVQEHVRSGIFVALQRAAIAALTGPQDTVEERRALYEARRDRVVAALPGAALRGHVLRLVPAPRRAHLRAPARRAPRRGRAGRGVRRGRPRLRPRVARTRDDALDEGSQASARVRPRVESRRVRRPAAAVGRRARRRPARRDDGQRGCSSASTRPSWGRRWAARG